MVWLNIHIGHGKEGLVALFTGLRVARQALASAQYLRALATATRSLPFMRSRIGTLQKRSSSGGDE